MRKKNFVSLFLFLAMVYLVGVLAGYIKTELLIHSLCRVTAQKEDEEFRAMEWENGILDLYYEHCDTWYGKLLFADKNGNSPGESKSDYLRKICMDIKQFPIPKDDPAESDWGGISFEDSWGTDRSYGGKRRHEGTDLMPGNSKRGIIPIASVSEGMVEQIGWLELGGWRVGIRAPQGTYFYYAHLDHYARGLKKGDVVRAGEIIGYMGDSGYGKEGTVGKFAVHLHFGIYLDMRGEEVSVNPYPILKKLKEKN